MIERQSSASRPHASRPPTSRTVSALLAAPVLLGLAAGAAAAPGVVPEAATTAQAHLTYEAYAAGLNVLDFAVGIDMTPATYRVQLDFHTAGMFGALVHADTDSVVAGSWAGNGAVPARYYAYGHVRGVPRRTQIDYAGGQPHVAILEPADDAEREPVPPDLERDSVDTLSAMARLVRTVALTGHCDGAVRTFDGRRVSEITVHDAGMETLTPTSGSAYAGPARRCDFEGRQLAGFVRDVDRAELARPQHGSAWLAPLLPGMAPLPVRMSFHTRFFGDATMYVTAAAPGAALAASR